MHAFDSWLEISLSEICFFLHTSCSVRQFPGIKGFICDLLLVVVEYTTILSKKNSLPEIFLT